MEEIALYIRHKDQGLSNSMIRGVNGCSKLLKKIFACNTVVQSQPKKRYKDNSSQTIDDSGKESLEFCTTPELNSLRELSSKLQNVKFSRITRKLCDIYDSICKMHTEIPTSSPSSPKEYSFDTKQAAKIIEININDFHKQLTAKLAMKKTFGNSNHKETQSESMPDIKHSTAKKKNATSNEKEVDAALLQQNYNNLMNEKKKLDDQLERLKLNMQDIEKRYNENELELFQTKNKNSALEEELKSCKMRNVMLTEKLSDKDKFIKTLKEEISDLKVKLVGKRNKLQGLRDSSFQANVHWRIAEEKLKQIENAWHQNFGEQFKFEEIDVNEIIRRFKIFKDGQSDDENAENSKSKTEQEFADINDLDKSNIKKPGFVKRGNPANYPKPRPNPVYGSQPQNAIESKIPKDNYEESTDRRQKRYDSKVSPNKKSTNKNSPNLESEEEEETEEQPPPEKNATSRKSQRKNTELKKKDTSNANKSNKPSSTMQPSSRDSPQRDKTKTVSQSGIQAQLSEKDGIEISSPEPTQEQYFNESFEPHEAATQLLSAQEKEIISRAADNEKNFFESLSEEQRVLFKVYNESLEKCKFIQKLSNAQNNSKATQYKLVEFSNSPRMRKTINNSPSSPRSKRSRLDGDSIMSGPGKTIVHRSTVSENFTREYEGIIDNKRLKMPALVVTIFNGEAEIQNLSTQLKLELVKCLEGHDEKRCDNECIHLKRAMEIKQKSRGVPYPLKTTLIDGLT